MGIILLLLDEASKRSEYLLSILNSHFEVLTFSDVEKAVEFRDDHIEDIEAVIIDNPSKKFNINKCEELAKERSKGLKTIPVLVLTDKENIHSDEKYLDTIAVSIITAPYDSEKVVLTRIHHSHVAVNSLELSEFSKMLNALPSLIYVKDTEGRYMFCSQAWYHVYNHTLEGANSIIGKTDFDIRKDQANAKLAHEKDMEVIKTGKGLNYLIKEEDEFGRDYLRIIKEPLWNDDGSIKGIIAIVNNVTEEEELKQEFRRQSITDTLTGLYNRTYLDEMANIIKEDSSNFPLTVLTCDCDNLKKINDKFGHFAGDHYIQMTGELIKSTVPNYASVFRMGGDEFAAIIPHMNEAGAKKLLKELDKNIANYKTDKYSLSVSFGAISIKDASTSLDHCLIISDKRMYRNKRKKLKG